MLLVLLSGCATAHSNVMPDVVNYTRPVMNKAADEIEQGTCPTLGETMMPDYQVMRDQARLGK